MMLGFTEDARGRGRGWRLPSRLDVLAVAGLLVLLALTARLYALTIHRHQELALKAERRSQRVEIRSGRRGGIVDRKGRPLAFDRQVTDVAVSLPDLDPTLSLVSPLGLALRVKRAESLRILRAARDAAARIDRSLVETRTHTLAVLPLEEGDRVRRIVRRHPHLRAETGPDGLRIVTSVAVLRLRDEVLARLASLLGIPVATLRATVRAEVDRIQALVPKQSRRKGEQQKTAKQARHEEWLKPFALVQEASFDLLARVRERDFELPGLRLVERFSRRYPQRDVAVHLIGYMRGPTAAEARRDRQAGIVLTTVNDALQLLRGGGELDRRTRLWNEGYGRVGLERHLDAELRGVPGVRLVVRDVKNRVRQALRDLPPRDGKDLELTIDLDVQRGAELALDRAVLGFGEPSAGGAAVLFDLRDGDVLALASSPRFDANTLGKHYRRIAKDPRAPQRHRALEALPPASTWKCLAAFAMFDPDGLASLPRGWTTVCTGSLKLGRSRFRCEGVHGRIGLARALERSCNVFFFAAADRIGLEPLADWAGRVGLGDQVGLDLGGEYRGLIPRPGYKVERFLRQGRAVKAWSRRVLAARYRRPFVEALLARAKRGLRHATYWQRRFGNDREIHPGEIRNSIIGQGDVLATPLQVAAIAALVATGGDFPRPRILKGTTPQRRQVALDADTLDTVRQGMRRVVTRGTASKRRIGLRDFDVAGKTGTAERRKGDPYVAWFMGYYPASNPQVAFAVVVDQTRGHGGDVCGPVARALLEAYEASRGGRLR